jgi:hypothetical protein
MNSFQYAIAKAAWEAFQETQKTRESPREQFSFDDIGATRQRAWLSAAEAVLRVVQKYASGWQQ